MRILPSFFHKNSAHEIMQKNGVGRYVTDENIMWRMRFACWMTDSTNSHPEFLKLFVFQQQ